MRKLHLRLRCLCPLVLSLVFVSLGDALAEPPAAPKQYIVHFALKRGLRTGSVKEKTLKIDAEPMIVATENNEVNFGVGGEVKVGKELVFYGTRVKLTLKSIVEGQVIVEGKIEVSHLANREAGFVIKSATDIHFSQPVVLNKQVIFSITKTELEEQWLEVCVKPVAARPAKVD